MRMKMNERFKKLIEEMPGMLQSLESKPFRTRDNLVGIPAQGVYVFYENNKALYVGRSNRLKERIQEHSRPSSKKNSATFAFNIAGKEMARYRDISMYVTRKELEQISGFNRGFVKAKKRVSKMKIRVVQIDNQIEQALFEIYAALALKTSYNDFRTH